MFSIIIETGGDDMDFEMLVNQYYESLSSTERHIAHFIIEHKSTIDTYSSEDLAKACLVTRPTILRTLKKLGIATYSELKFLLKQHKTHEVVDIELDDISNHYHQMIEDIFSKEYHSICKLLLNAKQIYIYGTGNEQKSIVEEFKRMMLSLGMMVMDFYDQGEVEFQLSHFSEEDVFILVSLSGESTKALDIIKKIKPTDIKLLSLTKLKNNTMSLLCDYNLYVGTKRIPIKQKDGYEIVTSFYVLLDALYIHCLDLIKELTI